MRATRWISLASFALVSAAAPLASGQTTSLLNFGYTNVPVVADFSQSGPGLNLATGGTGTSVLMPAGGLSLTPVQLGFTPTQSPTLDFDPAPFDAAGPGVTFSLTENPINGEVSGSLTLTDADGDRIVAGFVGSFFQQGDPQLLDAFITSFDFVASGDGTNDSTFDDFKGNSFAADNLTLLPNKDNVGTVQITSNFFGTDSGVSLVQGTIFVVPTPATPLAFAAAAGLLARRRR